MQFKFRLTALAASAAALGIAVSAGGAAASPKASVAASGPKVDLSGICPATVVIQTDWDPEADHGSTYQLLGPNVQINSGKKSVTGAAVRQRAADRRQRPDPRRRPGDRLLDAQRRDVRGQVDHVRLRQHG